MNNPKVFILILHYGEQEDTLECLDSLKKLDYPNFEVLAVDNDPNHRLGDLNFNYKVTKLVNAENRGFSGGNNTGIKYALNNGADYILLLNNDTVIEPEFLKKLVEAGEKDEKIGILGPMIYKCGTDEIHFAGGKISWLYNEAKHVPGANDFITGACFLIKRKVVEKIGLMPEDYFLYFEDAEWCLKARRAGFDCKVVSEARIGHKVSKNTQEYSFSYIYYQYRNGLLLAKRNAPLLIKILAYKISFLVYIKQVIKLVLMPSKKDWARAAMRGIGDFYKGKTGKFIA
ncbi:MAG: glycosyltransferase family 2 protein [bacterium]|nr:glycosyltransferase family 2 protein [bacterium]